jgi:hypothetical protein
MKFPKVKLFPFLAIAILAGSCPGFGAWLHNSSTRTANVSFAEEARFNNGTVLPAGDYRMEVQSDTQQPSVKFFKVYNGVEADQTEVANKAAASIEATVVTEPRKNATTEVLSDSHGDVQVVKSISPAGWNEQLVFKKIS